MSKWAHGMSLSMNSLRNVAPIQGEALRPDPEFLISAIPFLYNKNRDINYTSILYKLIKNIYLSHQKSINNKY